MKELRLDKEAEKQLEQIDEYIKNTFENFIGRSNDQPNKKVFEDNLNCYIGNRLGNNLITFKVEGDKTIINLVPYYKDKKIESYREVDLETAIKECIKTDSNIIFEDDMGIEVGVNKSNNSTNWLRKPNESDEELRNRIK